MGMNSHVRQGLSLATAAATLMGLSLIGAGSAWADDETVDVSGSDGQITLNNVVADHTYSAVRVGEYLNATKSSTDNTVTSVSVQTAADVLTDATTALNSTKGASASADAAFAGNPVGEVASKWLGYAADGSEDTVSNSGSKADAWGRDGKLRSFVTALAAQGGFSALVASSTQKVAVAAGQTSVQFSGLPEGLYVLVDTSDFNNAIGKRSNSIPMMVGTTIGADHLTDFATGSKVGEVSVKDDMASIKKTVIKDPVKGSAVSIGDYIHYRITVKVPLTTGYDPSQYVYSITDEPTNGLQFEQDATHPVTVKGKVGAATTVSEIDSSRYTVTPGTLSAEGARGATFDLAKLVTDNDPSTRLTWQDDITIDYFMRVNDFAKAGVLKNQATLTYSNNPTDPSSRGKVKTDPDGPDSRAYFYNFKIRTLAKADSHILPGAEFNLSRSGGTPLYFIEETAGSGIYKLAMDQSAPATRAATNRTKNLRVSDDGILKVDGLGADTYHVAEVVQPQGFSATFKPAFDVKISLPELTSTNEPDASKPMITNGKDAWGLVAENTANLAQVTQAAFDPAGTETTEWSQDVTKPIDVYHVNSVSQLPLTGGAGVVLAVLVALLLAGSAGVLMVVRSRTNALRA